MGLYAWLKKNAKIQFHETILLWSEGTGRRGESFGIFGNGRAISKRSLGDADVPSKG